MEIGFILDVLVKPYYLGPWTPRDCFLKELGSYIFFPRSGANVNILDKQLPEAGSCLLQ